MYHLARTLYLLLFIFYSGFAQDTTAIRFSEKITASEMYPYLEVLTSDSLEGRETGKPGQKKAASYIASEFRSCGLEPIVHGGYFQHTYLSANANRGKNFQVRDKYFLFMKDYFYPSGLLDSTIMSETVSFAGYGLSTTIYDDYKGINIAGGTVIFFEGAPENKRVQTKTGSFPGLSTRINTAKIKGASSILIITDSIQKIIDEFTYENRQPLESELPYAYITREMAKYIFLKGKEDMFTRNAGRIEKKGKPGGITTESEIKLNFVKDTDGLRGENVCGFLPGTDKRDEVLVLTAHYDHLGKRDSLICYGADDDGSGTSAVLEMAKTFSEAAKAGHPPRRSILFMTVSGEEKGLLGSRYYVKYPVLPLANTIANLNTDMIGRTDEKHDSLNVREYVYIIGSDKLSTTLHSINENANASVTKLKLDYTFNHPDDPNRYYYRSDHYNFAKNNIPVIFYFNGSHADYHKPSDTIDKIQFDLLAKRTQLIFLTAWELVNREDRIKVDVESDMPVRRED